MEVEIIKQLYKKHLIYIFFKSNNIFEHCYWILIGSLIYRNHILARCGSYASILKLEQQKNK